MKSEPNSEPEVLEAEWSRLKIEAWFEDLESHADVQHVQIRFRSAAAGRPEGKVALAEAQRIFQQDLASAIQVFYRFDGDAYCDTIIPDDESVKIIRARIPEERMPD